MTMLERAARALFVSYLSLAYGSDGCPADEAQAIWIEGRDGFITSARAVLMSVREPSESLSGAARSTEDWEAMIDAILSEGAK